MNVPTRLTVFAVAVVLAFGAAFAVGAAFGPDIAVDPAGAAATEEMGDDHDDT